MGMTLPLIERKDIRDLRERQVEGSEEKKRNRDPQILCARIGSSAICMIWESLIWINIEKHYSLIIRTKWH